MIRPPSAIGTCLWHLEMWPVTVRLRLRCLLFFFSRLLQLVGSALAASLWLGESAATA